MVFAKMSLFSPAGTGYSLWAVPYPGYDRFWEFSNLSYEYYQGDDLTHFRKCVDVCRNFVQNFEQDYHNLFFYGTVGTGKSFLSGCIASELLQTGHSVIYFSASGLFDTLARYAFDSRAKMLSPDSTRICITAICWSLMTSAQRWPILCSLPVVLLSEWETSAEKRYDHLHKFESGGTARPIFRPGIFPYHQSLRSV